MERALRTGTSGNGNRRSHSWWALRRCHTNCRSTVPLSSLPPRRRTPPPPRLLALCPYPPLSRVPDDNSRNTCTRAILRVLSNKLAQRQSESALPAQRGSVTQSFQPSASIVAEPVPPLPQRELHRQSSVALPCLSTPPTLRVPPPFPQVARHPHSASATVSPFLTSSPFLPPSTRPVRQRPQARLTSPSAAKMQRVLAVACRVPIPVDGVTPRRRRTRKGGECCRCRRGRPSRRSSKSGARAADRSIARSANSSRS